MRPLLVTLVLALASLAPTVASIGDAEAAAAPALAPTDNTIVLGEPFEASGLLLYTAVPANAGQTIRGSSAFVLVRGLPLDDTYSLVGPEGFVASASSLGGNVVFLPVPLAEGVWRVEDSGGRPAALFEAAAWSASAVAPVGQVRFGAPVNDSFDVALEAGEFSLAHGVGCRPGGGWEIESERLSGARVRLEASYSGAPSEGSAAVLVLLASGDDGVHASARLVDAPGSGALSVTSDWAPGLRAVELNAYLLRDSAPVQSAHCGAVYAVAPSLSPA